MKAIGAMTFGGPETESRLEGGGVRGRQVLDFTT